MHSLEEIGMSETKRIFKLIDGYRETVIELQRELTSRVALGPKNGGSGEHQKADYLLDLLSALKPDHLETIRAPDQQAQNGYRPNIVARWDGELPGPTVWVLAHLDIVPPGDLSLWDGDPYEVRVVGDKIIGRGVEDNQHGIVSGYLGMKAIQDAGLRPQRSVGLAFVADEETGSQYGLDYLLTEHRDLFRKDSLIIVPDGGNEKGTMIEVAEKSMLWIKVIVTGRQCHASTPYKGKNSLYGAAKLIVALESLKERFSGEDSLFHPPQSTFEPTKIEANVPNINTIPGKDVFYIDCRILPDYSVESVMAFVKKKAEAIAVELDLDIQIEPYYRQDARNPTSPNAAVVQVLKRAIKKVTGFDASPMGIGGGTVAAFFREAGFSAAVWLTEPDTPHQPNEYCLISNIMTDAKVFATLFLREEEESSGENQ